MRRSRRKRNSIGLSLFPFLAVLICTMGVLIVLLVLVTQQANMEAVAAAEAHDSQFDEKQSALRGQIERETLRAELLTDMKPEVQQRLVDMRLTRSHMEDQIRQLRERAEQITAQLELLEQDADLPDVARLRDELAAAVAERERLEQEASNARQRLQAASVSYAVVPYQGPNSTNRRPIYLECKDESIILQPHGIKLTPEQFTNPILAGNPLDASLLAIREYWQRYGGAQDSGEPYPLIIVRPSGANAYAFLRHAMKSWDDEFGYELVDEELPLTFPGEDPTLAAHLREVILEAEKRQARMYTALTMRRQRERRSNGSAAAGGGSRTLIADRNGGGFVAADGSAGGLDTGSGGFGTSGQGSGDDSFANRQSGGSADGTPRDPRSDAEPGQSPTESRTNSEDNPQGQGSSSFGSIAQQRGAGWALPSKSPDATAYRKPIRITLSGEYLVVHSGSLTQIPDRTVSLSGPTRRHLDELVDAVWTLIDGWGFAGYNAYWKPELHITVLGDGDRRFDELMSLMRDSGLDLKRAR